MNKPLVVSVFGQSDLGLVREKNEDSFLIADLTRGIATPNAAVFNHAIGERGSLFLVADGMGGVEAGEVASGMAVEIIAQRFFDRLTKRRGINEQHFVRILQETVQEANRAIFQEGQKNRKRRGMGTTLTAAAVYGTSIFFAQLGDSRAYLVRNGSIIQMTQDQSLVAQMVASGALRSEEAKGHPQRNVILQALGVHQQVEVVISLAGLKRGDRVVLCSDGLWGKVEAEEVKELLERRLDPRESCQSLVELARERGGDDNITVIVAEFDGEGLACPNPEELPVYEEPPRRFWLRSLLGF